MAKADAVFIYIGTYPNEAAARADYDVVKDLHAAGAVGTYDAAVVTKDDGRQGARQQGRDGHPARRAGAARPPARSSASCSRPSIIGAAAVGAASAGSAATCGAACPGPMSRSSATLIDDGQAALVIVGESTLEQALDKAELKAEKHVAKELDVSAKDVDKAVQEAAKDLN